MGILLWIVFGALVGWAASTLMGSPGGLLSDIIIGIVGSVVGGFVMSFFGQGSINGFTVYSFLVSLLGAVILILVVRAVR